MDERIDIDLNGKRTLPLRLLRAAVVAARTGWSDRLAAGQFLKIVDPCGKQAGDFWAFNAADPTEHLSAMHKRVWVNRLCDLSTSWGVIISKGAEFVVPDTFGALGVVPLSPTCCLVANQASAEISSECVAMPGGNV